MRKLLVLLSTILLICCTIGCSKGNKEEVSSEIQTHIPTLEETLGCTGDNLVQTETLYTYKGMSLYVSYTLNEEVNGVAVEHHIKEDYTYESDGNISDIWYTKSDTNNNKKVFDTKYYYGDVKNKLLYISDRKTPWVVTSLYGNMEYHTSLGKGTTVTSFEKQNDTLVVTGQSSKLNDSSLDILIKSVINAYGIKDATYTYTAKYGDVDRQLRKIDATVTVPTEGTYNGNKVSLSNIEVKIILAEGDSVKKISIPDNVKNNAVKIERPEPTTQQVQTQQVPTQVQTQAPTKQEPTTQAITKSNAPV